MRIGWWRINSLKKTTKKQMSKEPKFKLLSKEEIEKNRITAYKYIDMSKEQTPIDGLDILRALIDSNEKYGDYRISTETVKICLDEIERFIIKEKEQKEEVGKWISVKDSLPELSESNGYGKYSKPVLCLHKDGHHEDCQLNEGIDEGDQPCWSYIQDGELCETVTHWMELPNKPTK
jgi:hypothetical protein